MHSAEMRAAVRAHEANPEGRLKKLYLWDNATRSARLYADVKSACFEKGVIRYTVRLDEMTGRRTVREGSLGNEREIEEIMPVLTNAERREYVGGLRCKPLRRSELVPPAASYRHVVTLNHGDGYLDLGPGGGPSYAEERNVPDKNLTLFSERTHAPVKLPMTWDQDFSPSEVTYSAYRGAYVLHPRPSRSQSASGTGPLMVYLLQPDGHVERKLIPYSPAEYLIDPQPTKRGWIFGGGDFYKTSGLYLYDEKSVSKVDTGLVQKVVVSPDGCSAAVVIQNKHLETGAPFNLRIFEICGGGR